MAKYLMSERTAAWVRGQMEGRAPSSADGQTRLVRPAGYESDEFARPFEVRFASSVGESGAWIVWIPSSSVLMIDGEAVSVTDELEDAGSPYPSGWYVLDFLSAASGGNVYLNVYVPEESEDDEGTSDVEQEEESPYAEFSSDAGEDEEGFKAYPILVASCSGKSVIANVDSAIILGGSGSGKMKCVTSLNDETGDMDIIGGVGIEVETNGNTIKVSLNEDKETEDDDPNDQNNPCDHPGNNKSDDTVHGGGGGVESDEDNSSKKVSAVGGIVSGCSDCGGNSTTGGTSTGSPEKGADGKESGGSSGNQDVTPPSGKEVSDPPSSSSGGSGSSGSSSKSSTGPNGKEATGLVGTIGTKTPIYTGTHKQLTETKKMNESPFKTNGTAKTIEQTQASTKKAIYSGTHDQLTDTKKMNKSPWAK